MPHKARTQSQRFATPADRVPAHESASLEGKQASSVSPGVETRGVAGGCCFPEQFPDLLTKGDAEGILKRDRLPGGVSTVRTPSSTVRAAGDVSLAEARAGGITRTRPPLCADPPIGQAGRDDMRRVNGRKPRRDRRLSPTVERVESRVVPAPVPVPAAAASFVVTTTADNGDDSQPIPGSLRQGILEADQGSSTRSPLTWRPTGASPRPSM